MKIIIFIISIFFISTTYSQTIIYGLPSIDKELYINDIIIINIPNHLDGRFKRSIELSNLKTFLSTHSEISFMLYINVFRGSSELCLDYSEFLSKNLKKKLACKNVKIEGKGSENPIFLEKKSSKYFTLNTRIEILVVNPR